jgi:hypothetical protein
MTEVDFGDTPAYSSYIFTITDANVNASSKILAQLAYDAPTGKDLDELDMDVINVAAGAAGIGSFMLMVGSADGSWLHGKFKINYTIG